MSFRRRACDVAIGCASCAALLRITSQSSPAKKPRERVEIMLSLLGGEGRRVTMARRDIELANGLDRRPVGSRA